MNIGLIIIGDEILSGKRQDKHLAKFIELLSARGLSLAWAQYLGDDRAHITAQLKNAVESGDLVISCGGIGATPDDHTRQAAAAALEQDLTLHPEARELILQRARQMAAEQGTTLDESHPDTLRRLEMGMFPAEASIIPNPYNRIPGFCVGHVHFVPGFPVMAHPMMEWVLDQAHYRHLQRAVGVQEKSLIVQGAMEASLTPLMEAVEAQFCGIKVFSLPSVDHPQWGKHIELGVKWGPQSDEIRRSPPVGVNEPRGGPAVHWGEAAALDAAYAALKTGIQTFGAVINAEMVR